MLSAMPTPASSRELAIGSPDTRRVYLVDSPSCRVYQFIQHTTLTNPNSNTDVINTTAINDGQYSSSIGSISLSGNGRTDSTSIDNRFTNSVPQTGIRRRPEEAANAEMHQQFNHFNLKRPRLQTSDNVHSSVSLTHTLLISKFFIMNPYLDIINV
ncbi:unnamed protein product [Schistosoma mattheei]|uniref:Uncharacterized protein n=1 Tax=Schistosoma mattheei TaxID=31246 RepID=A0A183Q029_9TREM|nr:unnamed protein product [Schistosoma mattheei]